MFHCFIILGKKAVLKIGFLFVGNYKGFGVTISKCLVSGISSLERSTSTRLFTILYNIINLWSALRCLRLRQPSSSRMVVTLASRLQLLQAKRAALLCTISISFWFSWVKGSHIVDA